MTLEEIIASEVMDVIERERRINKDDLIMAARVAIMKHQRTEGVPATTAPPDLSQFFITPWGSAAEACATGISISTVGADGSAKRVSAKDWMKV